MSRGWNMEPTRRWFCRCDECGMFRLWADYFDVYYTEGGFHWECERCLLKTITAYSEELARVSSDRQFRFEEEITRERQDGEV